MTIHFAMDLRRERNLAKQLGAAIARKRENLGLTQEQVAELFGIGNQAISRIERGAVMPTIPRLFEFADVFKCGVDELLLKASDRDGDQAVALGRELASLQSSDREFITVIVRQLSEHLRTRAGERTARR
jgi:transcriptional regulator with XRE-family HTH domain